MYLPLSPRDGPFPQTTTTFEKKCHSISWRVWCPIDIVLWAIVFLLSALLFWKLYRRKKTKGRDSDDQSQVAQNAGLQDGISIKNNPDNQHPYLLSDPRQIVHSQESSIIAKDASFLSTPAPALLTMPNSSSGRLTGLGISFGSTSTLDLRFAQMQGISWQGSSRDFHLPPSMITTDAVEIGNTLPPPAYVRDTETNKM